MLKEDQDNLEEFDDEEDDYEDGDFGFIIAADGTLKSLMIPEFLMDDPPREVKKILKIFGIKDVHQLEPRTLHWNSKKFGKYPYKGYICYTGRLQAH